MYFLDNTFPRQFAPAFREVGVDVQHLQEVEGFDGSTPDVVWMPEVAKRGWITLTADGRILKNAHELRVFSSCGLTLFVMHKHYSKRDLWTQFTELVRAWPAIEQMAERGKPGDCFQVTANCKVDLMKVKKKNR